MRRYVARAESALVWLGLVALPACGDAESGAAQTPADAADSAVWWDVQPAETAGPDAVGSDAASPDAANTDTANADAAELDTAELEAGAADDVAADGNADDIGADPDGAYGSDTSAPADAGPAADASGASDASQEADTGATSDEPVWNLPTIAEVASANCQFSSESTDWEGLVQVKTWKLKYLSWEVVDGVKKPIWISAFAARPVSGSKFPGVVQAHGLGGSAKANDATSLAGRLGVFAIAYTGPGGGSAQDGNQSEGLPSAHNNGYRMFDVIKDVRGSWFWGHATAAMRGITCLTSRSEVDTTKLGITGFSAGGVTSLLVAGHDTRVKASVPLSGTLAWDVATLSPTAWQHTLLQKAGLSVSSAEWQKLMAQLISPAVALASAKANVLMVNGTTDEFFPLTAHMATFNGIAGAEKRLALAGNFDHGCYGVSGGESAKTIEDRAKLRAEGGQAMWFGHWFGSDGDFSYLPQTPVLQIQPGGAASVVAATVDSGGSKLQVEEVRVWWSNDNAFLFGSEKLDAQGGGLYGKIIPVPLTESSVVYVDVTYKTKLLGQKKFALASLPWIGAQHVPKIRGIDSCL